MVNYVELLIFAVTIIGIGTFVTWLAVRHQPRNGVALGLKWGWLLSVGYTLGYWLVSRPFAMSASFTTGHFENEAAAFVFLMFYGTFIGILPSIMVAALVGLLVEGLLDWLHVRSARSAIIIGIVVSGALFFAIHVATVNLTNSSVPDFFRSPLYWELLGIPTCIAIAASGWAAHKLFTVQQRQSRPSTNSTQQPPTTQ